MGRVATQADIEGNTGITIPLTLGDEEMDDPSFDLIGDDNEDVDPQVTVLMEKIESMEATSLQDKEFLQNTILEMSQRPAPQLVAVPPVVDAKSAELNLDDLPDPVEKAAEFTAELGKRVKDYVKLQTDNTTATVTAQATTQAGLSDLENRFTRDYKTLAGKPGVFQAIVSQEVAKLKNKGLNAQQYIFADPDKFLSVVAKQMKSELGIEDDEEELDDDGNAIVKKQTVKKKSRAKGVKAGSMPNLKKSGKDVSKKPLSFVKEFKKRQLAMGII